MKLLNLMEKRCIKFVAVSKQSDLIILFCKVPVRTFCNCFYSVSLDFLLLKEQNTKSITKTERFFGACSSSIINFFKTIMYSVNSAIFETIFFLTYEQDKDYSRDFFRIINNHYIEY